MNSYANHTFKIELPHTAYAVAEVIAATVKSSGGQNVELLPAPVGDGWEVRGWIEADSRSKAAANWAAIIADLLEETGHIWRPAKDRANPRVTVAGVRRYANGTPRIPDYFSAAAALKVWRDVYHLS